MTGPVPAPRRVLKRAIARLREADALTPGSPGYEAALDRLGSSMAGLSEAEALELMDLDVNGHIKVLAIRIVRDEALRQDARPGRR